MPNVHANGIDIEYVSAGPADGPVILLVMGLAGQLTLWPDAFVEQLVSAGYRVVRFDNRDIGLTQKMEGSRAPNLILHALASRIGVKGMAGYKLEDMAADTVGLMDELNIERAHIVGVSMGGIISQIVSGSYPDRIASFTAIMSTTGRRDLPRANRDVGRQVFLSKRPKNRQEAINRSVRLWRLIGTEDSGSTDEELNTRAEIAFDRSNYPDGPKRQINAILETGDVRKYTRKITAPSLIIHGSADPLVPLACGQDIARNIPGSRMEIINGMGHDLPKKHLTKLAELIVRHASSVEDKTKKVMA